jgi:hypothetical protein
MYDARTAIIRLAYQLDVPYSTKVHKLKGTPNPAEL